MWPVAPFERFSPEAKRTLSLAQEEAEAKRQSYIGTEHLLLALVANQDGLAHVVLMALGVEAERVPQVIEEVRTGDERPDAQKQAPTSRVKRAIEIAFDESRREEDPYVGTEHLLLGLLIEANGIGAHALQALGVTLPQVRTEIARQRVAHSVETVTTPAPTPTPHFQPRFSAFAPAGLPDLGPDAVELLGFAAAIATAEKAPSVGLDHIVRALDDNEVWSMLQVSARIRQVVAAREEAIAARDPKTADEQREEERKLREEHRRAEAEWRRRLG